MEKFIKEITIDPREREIEKKPITIPDIETSRIINQFKDNISSIKAKFKVYDNLLSSGLKTDADDILRSQVVFLESALDFYLHEIVKYSILKMFKGEKPKTESYKNIIVSVETLESAIKNPESVDWLSDDVIHRHHYKTFVSNKEIKRILSMVTKNKAFEEISAKLEMTNNQLITKLDNLYERRNKIAHQSDRNNKTATLYAIEKNEVIEYIELIERFVIEMHIVVTKDI